MPTPPRNPYIAGNPLNSSRGFFGREDVFREVETVLSSPDQNSIVLFGQRRIGKTSILLNLQSRLPSPPFVPVYFDLMDNARKSLAEVLNNIAQVIVQQVGLNYSLTSNFDKNGRDFRTKFLPQVFDALGSQKRLVLLFDEFDVLSAKTGDQLAEDAAAVTFFPYLRDLMLNEKRLAFVFVVGRRADDLGIEFKEAFKASRYHPVSVLDEESAKSLILGAEREKTLHFEDGAVRRILELTTGHPYLTQLVCQLLFEKAYSAKDRDEQIPTVTASDVEMIIPKVLKAGENVFEWIWDGMPPAEKVILAALAPQANEKKPVTQRQLEQTLREQGIRVMVRDLEYAPRTLVEWEMLKQVDGGYQLFIELIRQWIVDRKPLNKVREQLDLIDPIAENLYQSGNGFYRTGEYDRAFGLLQSSLTMNPSHLKARLLLGEIYRVQEKFDDAIVQLDEAYRIDKEGSRVSLENVLMQRAELYEQRGQTNDALRDYARVLKISPYNQIAKDHADAIWFERGKKALEAGDLDTATTAFTIILNLKPYHIDAARQIDRISHLKRGEDALKLGELDIALTEFSAAGDMDRLAKVNHLVQQLSTIFAAARILDHEENQPLYLDNRYTLLAGIVRDVPKLFKSSPIELTSNEDLLQFEISVHADGMDVEPRWTQTFIFNKKQEQADMIEFNFNPQVLGQKEISVDFFFQRHWLAKIAFNVLVDQKPKWNSQTTLEKK
jgi:tetratricopeptide (TPR) repeat protein